MLSWSLSEVVIELAETEYTYSEEDGEVPVCVQLTEGELDGVTVSVQLTTQPDTASQQSEE